MLRRLLTAAALGLAATAGVLTTTGCASNDGSDEPYALTGDADRTSSQSASDRRAATDSKGHYRPDLEK